MTQLLEDLQPPQSRQLRKRVSVPIALLVMLLVGAGVWFGGRQLLKAVVAGPADYSGPGTGRVVVQVHPGDTARDIGATLARHAVVKSSGAFSAAASADARSLTLQPGFFGLRAHMSGKQALALMLSPAARLHTKVTLPEGRPLSAVLDRLVAVTRLRRADFLAALRHPASLGLPAYARQQPEGFLFPATYDVDPGSRAGDVLAEMTGRYGEEAAAVGLDAGARALHKTPYDIVKIASLIEAETPLDADRAKVARVIYNRLARGMPLQLDSTVNYVRAQKKARLSVADTRAASPYNTYLHPGLPPTPIDSPGRRALVAALHPAVGSYLYFVTIDKRGHSLFTSSYPQFLAAQAKAQRDGVY